MEKRESEEMKQILNTMKIINHSFKKESSKPDKEELEREAPENSESEAEVVHTPSTPSLTLAADNSVEFQLVPNAASSRNFPKAVASANP